MSFSGSFSCLITWGKTCFFRPGNCTPPLYLQVGKAIKKYEKYEKYEIVCLTLVFREVGKTIKKYEKVQ